jgi:hypothetical protein
MSETLTTRLKRLAACLIGSVVLAVMVGPQEGTREDFGISFREGVLKPRIFVFLAIGVIVFLAITFWPRVRPYIRRPGVMPGVAGLLIVIVAQTIMNWFDPLAAFSASPNAKFSKLRDTVDQTNQGLASTTKWFFVDYGAWTLAGVAVVAIAA